MKTIATLLEILELSNTDNCQSAEDMQIALENIYEMVSETLKELDQLPIKE